MSFETRYDDDSGVEFAVRLKPSFHGEQIIEFEHVGTCDFPADRMDWLIGCLERIRTELTTQEPTP